METDRMVLSQPPYIARPIFATVLAVPSSEVLHAAIWTIVSHSPPYLDPTSGMTRLRGSTVSQGIHALVTKPSYRSALPEEGARGGRAAAGESELSIVG